MLVSKTGVPFASTSFILPAGTSSFEATLTNTILGSPPIAIYIMFACEINFAGDSRRCSIAHGLVDGACLAKFGFL
jgi:hypothetical protein